MALNDEEVNKQIKHMMNFIDQEANEKAEEIDTKAEEEFNIEKGRLVEIQRRKIMDFYERKEKQINLQKKIQDSNMLNQGRLKVLKAREDIVHSVLEETRERLVKIIDSPKYKDFIRGLIGQALLQLLESKVVIRCVKRDLGLVKEVLPQAQQEYKATTKQDVSIEIDQSDFLPESCSGGVDVVARNGRIRVTNTLESRLDQVHRQMLPHIRNLLFGRNENRKFFD